MGKIIDGTCPGGEREEEKVMLGEKREEKRKREGSAQFQVGSDYLFCFVHTSSGRKAETLETENNNNQISFRISQHFGPLEG